MLPDPRWQQWARSQAHTDLGLNLEGFAPFSIGEAGLGQPRLPVNLPGVRCSRAMELCTLGNICPDTADEAKALVPSLVPGGRVGKMIA